MRLFRRCGHHHVRCIHGDEINARHYRRIACTDCGRALKSWHGIFGALCAAGIKGCVATDVPTIGPLDLPGRR